MRLIGVASKYEVLILISMFDLYYSILGSYNTRRPCGNSSNCVMDHSHCSRFQYSALLEWEWELHKSGRGHDCNLQILQLYLWFHSPCQHQQLRGEIEFYNTCFEFRGGFGSGIGQIHCLSVENKFMDNPSANHPLISLGGWVGWTGLASGWSGWWSGLIGL